jgi:transcriptional regulator with XRE-family HTH domain
VPAKRKPWTWWEKAAAERGRRGWSVAELARRAGLDATALRRWLHGKHAPREGTVAKVAAAFGWPVAYLADPAMPYEPTLDREEAARIVAGLSADALKVVNALGDPQAVAFLARCVDQYHDLRRTLGR